MRIDQDDLGIMGIPKSQSVIEGEPRSRPMLKVHNVVNNALGNERSLYDELHAFQRAIKSDGQWLRLYLKSIRDSQESI